MEISNQNAVDPIVKDDELPLSDQFLMHILMFNKFQ